MPAAQKLGGEVRTERLLTGSCDHVIALHDQLVDFRQQLAGYYPAGKVYI